MALVLMAIDFLGAITRIYREGMKAQTENYFQNCVRDIQTQCTYANLQPLHDPWIQLEHELMHSNDQFLKIYEH